MQARTYGQMCPVAIGLDIVGERWTLLIIRELLLGPKRFKELLAELPAMGTNRLSQRLKQMETNGLLARRTLPPPGEAQVYELTDDGEGLRSIVVDLARWAAGRPIDERIDRSTARAVLLGLVRSHTARPELTRGIHETYEFAVGDERFHLIAADGTVTPRSGPAPVSPDVRVRCDIPTLLALDGGRLTPARAKREGRAEIDGAADATRRAMGIFRRPR